MVIFERVARYDLIEISEKATVEQGDGLPKL
jgi:hypothetical protein